MEKGVPAATVDLNERGMLLSEEGGQPVSGNRVPEYLRHNLPIPHWATDIYVHVHGWRTLPDAATRQAQLLLGQALQQRAARPDYYLDLSRDGFRPWLVSVRWPSSSRSSLSGYRRIRDRAHEMGAEGQGQAAYVISHLLGYLDQNRITPGSHLLKNRFGQFLHLCGHSFGGRFLCEAVQWAASQKSADLLSWSVGTDPQRPFTVDSLLVFQMAAPRDALEEIFPALLPGPGRDRWAPLCGPIVLTHSRYDRATGIWHRQAEGSAGIGFAGARRAPTDVHRIQLLPLNRAYAMEDLDHRIVNVDASWLFRRGRLSFAGAHSDINYPESAHLLLSLADLSR